MSNFLDIIGIYLKDYRASFSGREIARLTNSSPQSTLSYLNKLFHKNILKIKKEGRNKIYSLNLKELNTQIFLAMVELKKSEEFLNIEELNIILERLLPLAETTIVFGSFAKKRHKNDSDLDLIMLNVKNKKMVLEFAETFPREINIEFVTWNQFKKSFLNNNYLSIEIKKDHLVYGNSLKLVQIYCEK